MDLPGKRNRHLAILSGLILNCFAVLTIQAQEDYEAWLREQDQQFQSFKDERDRQFSEFLKQSWHPVDARDVEKPDVSPKPVTIPLYRPSIPEAPVALDSSDPIDLKSPFTPHTKQPSPLKEEDRMRLEEKQKVQPGMTVLFFGQLLSFGAVPIIKMNSDRPLSNDTIRAFWNAWSRGDYEIYTDRFKHYTSELQLNDWGVLQMLYATGESLYPQSRNHVRLFVWFMLNKSGYLARAGYQNDQVFLLAPTSLVLYEHSYFIFKGNLHKFYAIMFDTRDKPRKNSVIYTYDNDYPGADRVLDMGMHRLPRLSGKTSQKELRFNHHGQEYRTTVTVNHHIVDFFATFPQTTYEVYFEAPLSPDTKATLLPTLARAIKDLSETESVDLLLHFVQTAFDYQTDEDQFKKEKIMFADETLFYRSSDCEDRAILFAYLVRQLVGLEVVGLDYPGHIATGVKFNTPVEGDVVRYNNTSYVICDPTYIYADIGKPIPQVQDITPGIIKFGG